jgi:uncharacterized protein (DUF488 family)
MSELEIWTIGTSNRSIEEFLNLLAAYRIEAVVDVRRYPTSRHKHFKQEHLKASLNQCGIEYHHVTELGGYRKGGYTKYMKTGEFGMGLDYVETLARSKRVAIMTVIHIIDPGQCSEHKGRKRNKRLDEF